MKQVLVNNGKITVCDVPSPNIDDNYIIVKSLVSCLSVGTEMSGIKSSGIPLWKRAINQPEKLKKVFEQAKLNGPTKTWNLIKEKIDSPIPTGYSCCGEIIEIGKNIIDLNIGDKVACAGAQFAFHAEYIKVPRNLCVLIPTNVDDDSASTVTLGAIALQGVRRLKPTLGETFVIIGLGILGQLTNQLLKSNGCKTIGIDLDSNRIDIAEKLGLDVALSPDDETSFENIARLTDGIGADGVIITAASSSDAIISTAFKICRKKGRVVLVGDVGLNLNRSDFYLKEIDFYISTSYGPGRYDTNYEEQGIDYPISYVRWTENRNMVEYLNLISQQKINLKSLVSNIFNIEEAPIAYNLIKNSTSKPMMVLLKYNSLPPESKIKLEINNKRKIGTIKIAVIGAGGFAKHTHLPNILKLSSKFELAAVVNNNGHNALTTAKQFKAHYCSTNYKDILNDQNIDAVIIATRHNLHAKMVIDALEKGKHILVEKPLAINRKELDEIDLFMQNTSKKDKPILLTGYNRRFSPYANKINAILQNRTGPFIINYKMNAGYIPMDSWVHSYEGGGRNIGEACHIYDLFTFFANSKIKTMSAKSINPISQHYSKSDNFVANFEFEDGSLAVLTYTALGNVNYPKEQADIYVDGKNIFLNDYKSLEIIGKKSYTFKTNFQEKGLLEELEIFSQSINKGLMPIEWWQQKQVAEMALMVQESIYNNAN